MKCKTCRKTFDKKNRPIIFLDLGFDEIEGNNYCSDECFIEWVIGFAICRFGQDFVNKKVKESLANEYEI